MKTKEEAQPYRKPNYKPMIYKWGMDSALTANRMLWLKSHWERCLCRWNFYNDNLIYDVSRKLNMYIYN